MDCISHLTCYLVNRWSFAGFRFGEALIKLHKTWRPLVKNTLERLTKFENIYF